MEGFIKTTGKVYKKKTLKCKSCGNVFEVEDNISNCPCPNCSSLGCFEMQRTVSSVEQEMDNEKNKQ